MASLALSIEVLPKADMPVGTRKRSPPNGGGECRNALHRMADENRLRFDVSAIKAHGQGVTALPCLPIVVEVLRV